MYWSYNNLLLNSDNIKKQHKMYDKYFPEIDYFVVEFFSELIKKGTRSLENIPTCLHPFIRKKLAEK